MPHEWGCIKRFRFRKCTFRKKLSRRAYFSAEISSLKLAEIKEEGEDCGHCTPGLVCKGFKWGAKTLLLTIGSAGCLITKVEAVIRGAEEEFAGVTSRASRSLEESRTRAEDVMVGGGEKGGLLLGQPNLYGTIGCESPQCGGHEWKGGATSHQTG
jgi:hypothetical protein